MTDHRPQRLLLEKSGLSILATARGNLDATTDRYPEWTLADLLVHTSRVHRFVAPIVAQGLQAPPESREDPPSLDRALTFFEDGLDMLMDAFDQADPRTRCWGYGNSPTVGGWLQRMALETEIHRWDAESALGVFAPLEGAIAADGLDELAVMWLPSVRGEILTGYAAGTVTVLEATDLGLHWTIRIDQGVAQIERGADQACPWSISGTASDLYLKMMGRRHGELERRLGEAQSTVFEWLVENMSEAKI